MLLTKFDVRRIFIDESLQHAMRKVGSEHSELLNIGSNVPELKEIFDDGAQHLLALFCQYHINKWQDLMEQRSVTHALIGSGQDPDLLRATEHIRTSDWIISELPHDLQERRVELVLEPTSDLLKNGMRSGAKTLVLDMNALSSFGGSSFYRSHLHINALIHGMKDPETQRMMHPTIMMRPRSFEVLSKSVTYNGLPVPGLFIDLAIYLNSNAGELLSNGSGPYFSIAGIQGHLEARLVNDLFDLAQLDLNIPRGTIKATVLLDNIFATFEMDEIIFELSHHSAGMALNRWELYNCFLKHFGERNGMVCPDRNKVHANSTLLRSISLNMIATCHRRRAHAIGWMCEELPVESRESEFYPRIKTARKEKEIEAIDGHDGTQVLHYALVNMAAEEFNKFMPNIDQLNYSRNGSPHARDLVMPFGEISIEGIKSTIHRVLSIALARKNGLANCSINGRSEGSGSYKLALTELSNWVKDPKGVISKTGLEIDKGLIKFLAGKIAAGMQPDLDQEEKLILKQVLQEFIEGTGSKLLVKAAI